MIPTPRRHDLRPEFDPRLDRLVIVRRPDRHQQRQRLDQRPVRPARKTGKNEDQDKNRKNDQPPDRRDRMVMNLPSPRRIHEPCAHG